MTALADRIIVSLRSHHDRLVAVIAALDDEQLIAPSGASAWRICDVLSHLGSGSEIMRRPFAAAAAGLPVPEGDNQAVWDRWNAMSPREQATAYVGHGAALVEILEHLGAEQRESITIDLGFLPEPATLEVAAGMRLNEVAQHAWDVHVGLDPAAGIDPEAAEILLALLVGPLGFLLGFTGKADVLSEPTVVDAGDYALVVDDTVRLVTAGAEPTVRPTARFTGAAEAFVRLVGGRLTPTVTPAGVEVTGNVTLDDLRRVFPGF